MQSPDPLAESSERRKYWGFYFLWWSAITVLLAIATVSSIAQNLGGKIILACFGATVLSALYARYLHNWGRWRMIFIIF
ncbi:MAG: hypothetical protein ABSB96_05260 [Gaiellaceae bacterium]